MSLQMVPDDPARCCGREADGTQCICKRCSQTHLVDGRTLCTNCNHIESAHPELSRDPGSLIRQFQAAGKLGGTRKIAPAPLSPKATEEEADQETNSNLRKKKRKSGTDTEPPTRRVKAKVTKPQKEEAAKGEVVKLGHVVFPVSGTTGRPRCLTLKDDKPPNPIQLNRMCQYGIAVRSTPDRPLAINTGWETARCTKYFSTLFPELFLHLDRHSPKADPNAPSQVQKQQWLGVIKHRQSIALAADELPTGAQLAHHCKNHGHAAKDRILYIATKITVPFERYHDWEADSEEEEPEDEEMDFDMLDESDESPRKPVSKGKGKGKAPASEPPSVKKVISVKVEKPEDNLPSDMKKAAQIRTRLTSKTIKWNHIPYSSDNEKLDPIEVSDDEPDLPHPSTLSASLQTSEVSSSWTSPDFTSFAALNQSPSPDCEPPNIFEETAYDFTSLPPSPTPTGNISGTSSAWASTSSLASASSQVLVPPTSSENFSSSLFVPQAPAATASPSFPSSIGWMGTTSAVSNASAGSSSMTTAVGPSRPPALPRRGGKPKGLVNPWKR
ncbi:hypothetical protein DFH09DRAFT_1373411 [Mycena vulgaris]|nr:hypothetical protein DFH09DRAFT_1373411 [Mycena vulgaris]